MTTLYLLLGLLGSVAVHEIAHLLLAKHLGWQIMGFGFSRHTFGIRAKTSDPEVLRSLWMVAIIGPMANIMLGDFLYTLGTPLAVALAYANFLMGCINMIPFPGSDGRHILSGLRAELG